jgi:hypothetical protein
MFEEIEAGRRSMAWHNLEELDSALRQI